MWPVERPQLEVRVVFSLCISDQISPAKLRVLEYYEDPVVAATEQYEEACRAASLHLLDRAKFNPPKARASDAKDLVNMYEQRMAPDKPGREVRDTIRNAAVKCPLCGVGRVRQIDHHLPKAVYPYLAVAPSNLLPVCADCNYIKGERAPTSYGEQTLHPYFDDIDDGRWLRARLVVDLPDWYVEFFVSPPSSWSPLLTSRVEHHFEVFELARVYEVQSADELVGIAGQLETAFDAGGAPDVRGHLLAMARWRTRPRNNSWMTALYEAAADNIWYCSGGFREIADG
jgi:5-methylcytosine-specific restriction endonuclease McrA